MYRSKRDAGLLVMKGRNGDAEGIKGALTFQCRVRILTDGGKMVSDGGTTTVARANSATILVAAATSYKSWNDVSGRSGSADQELPRIKPRQGPMTRCARTMWRSTSACSAG